VGGKLKLFLVRGGRRCAWVSEPVQRHHMAWAWVSLFAVLLAFLRCMCAMGVFHDPRLF
jgi:hypothetical protein